MERCLMQLRCTVAQTLMLKCQFINVVLSQAQQLLALHARFLLACQSGKGFR